MARIQYWNSTGVKLYWGWDEISLCTDLLDRGQRAIVPTPEKKKKRNIRTATCSRFRGGDVPEEGSQFPSLANNEQADWIFWHIDIILHVVKIKKKISSLYQKTLVSRKASIIYLVLLDLYHRHSGYYFQINSISVSKYIFFLSLDMNRI